MDARSGRERHADAAFTCICQRDPIECETHHSSPNKACGKLRGWKMREGVVRSVNSYDVVANRFLLIGCAGIITLIVTLLVAALR